MFTAHSPRVEREAQGLGGGIVTYIAPEITASSRRDTGFGWPLQVQHSQANAMLDRTTPAQVRSGTLTEAKTVDCVASISGRLDTVGRA